MSAESKARGSSRATPPTSPRSSPAPRGRSSRSAAARSGTIGKPVAADVLDLSALAGIVSYEPAELVLTARAATPLATIERALAAHAQRLAFEPPDFGALLGARRGRRRSAACSPRTSRARGA